MGNTIILIGVGFIVVGLAYKFGLLDWFGNLPGDLSYKGERTFIFVPITSMLLISAFVSFVMWLMQR
jgi:di/tricarboxylate transporter